MFIPHPTLVHLNGSFLYVPICMQGGMENRNKYLCARLAINTYYASAAGVGREGGRTETELRKNMHVQGLACVVEPRGFSECEHSSRGAINVVWKSRKWLHTYT